MVACKSLMWFSEHVRSLARCAPSVNRILHRGPWLLLAVIAISAVTSGCWGDYDVHLTVENQMATQVKLTFSETLGNGVKPAPYSLGTVAAGETAQTSGGIMLGGISSDKEVLIQAADPSGQIVWQKSWNGKEFVKLKDVGWKVVISPETGSQ